MKTSALAKFLAISTIAVCATLSLGASRADDMQITGLRSGAALNMRIAPGTSNPVVVSIPSNATHINWTCNVEQVNGRSWYQVDWKGYHGWSSARFLSLMPGSHRHCATASVPQNQRIIVSPDPTPNVVQPGHYPHATDHKHRHSHRHGKHVHSHSHHHGDHHSHHSIHGSGGYLGVYHKVPTCVVKKQGALTIRLCQK